MSRTTMMEAEGVLCAQLRKQGDGMAAFKMLQRREGGVMRPTRTDAEHVETAKYYGEREKVMNMLDKVRIAFGWGVTTWARAVGLTDVVVAHNGVRKIELHMLALVCLWTTAKHSEIGSKTRVTAGSLVTKAGYCVTTPTTILTMERLVLNYAHCELQTPDPFTALQTSLSSLLVYTDSQPPSLCNMHDDDAAQSGGKITLNVSTADFKWEVSIPMDAPVSKLLPVVAERSVGDFKYVFSMADVDGLMVATRVVDLDATPRQLHWSDGEELYVCDDLKKNFFVATKRYTKALPYHHNRELIFRAETLVKWCLAVPSIGMVLVSSDLALLSLSVAKISISGKAASEHFLTFLSTELSLTDINSLLSVYGAVPAVASYLRLAPSPTCPSTPSTDVFSDALSSSVTSWTTLSPAPSPALSVEPQNTPRRGGVRKWSLFTKKQNNPSNGHSGTKPTGKRTVLSDVDF
eukprot:TRINITY_DN30527_c0_g1_i1.p1 TRINITY_DN30527_c0_g1~~TRINITY_DN30527_c0_g1_i1.p1  ORF type:complete len:478 (+),score=62.48 TRINITY_DN30527_c0_g1_i1:47-1435(+)